MDAGDWRHLPELPHLVSAGPAFERRTVSLQLYCPGSGYHIALSQIDPEPCFLVGRKQSQDNSWVPSLLIPSHPFLDGRSCSIPGPISLSALLFSAWGWKVRQLPGGGCIIPELLWLPAQPSFCGILITIYIPLCDYYSVCVSSSC